MTEATHNEISSNYSWNQYKRNTLPNWQELVSYSMEQANDPCFCSKVAKVKAHRNKILHNIVLLIGHLAVKDPLYKRYLKLSWEEIVDIICTQIAHNTWIKNEIGFHREELKPQFHNLVNDKCKDYFQQPCTIRTATQRVLAAKSFCKKEDKILLLGDDDMVGVQLARSGFKDITILDIDPKIIEYIRDISIKENLNLKLVLQDLAAPIPQKLIDDYSLVFLDPFYSIEGITLFMDAALYLTQKTIKTNYFLSIHLLSLMKKGLTDLDSLLHRLGIEITHFYQSFNTYPVPFKTKKIIDIVNRGMLKEKEIYSKGEQLSFFSSDAILLKKMLAHRQS